MNANDALTGYGFQSTEEGLVFRGPLGQKRTRYVAVDGGFNRYEWEDGAWRQYPYTIHPDWEGIAGLAFDAKQAAMFEGARLKPDCFEWVWPEDEIVTVYGA